MSAKKPPVCLCGLPATSMRFCAPCCDRCRNIESRLDYDFHTHHRKLMSERQELEQPIEEPTMSIKVVAFLQNPWFKPGTDEKHIIMYRDNQDFHRRVLLMCMTGQRLQTAFGDLYDKIWWDNTNWRPANHAAGKEEPDIQHMVDVIRKHQPKLVLCFGNQARDAMSQCFMGFFFANPHLTCYETMHCHHPNARYKTVQDLCDFAAKVRAKLLEYELLGGRNIPVDGFGLEDRHGS